MKARPYPAPGPLGAGVDECVQQTSGLGGLGGLQREPLTTQNVGQ